MAQFVPGRFECPVSLEMLLLAMFSSNVDSFQDEQFLGGKTFLFSISPKVSCRTTTIVQTIAHLFSLQTCLFFS